MANDGYSRQGNHFSSDETNSRIIQGNNFSGRVVESLQNAPPSGPDAPDIVWGDSVDGVSRGIVMPPMFQGGPSPVPRPRDIGFSTSEVVSPMQSE